jgi:hypothetical protein
MKMTRGRIERAQKAVVYGPEGIGKTTFAASFPNPLFIDTEGGADYLDVVRLEKPGSWSLLMEQVCYVRDHPGLCGTLVIDTADWSEQLCMMELCAKTQKTGIEDFGYGKGYVYLAEEFSKFLRVLEETVDTGIHVVVTAHASMRKFEQPDELGSYDRWEMKLQKKTAPLLKEWADMVLFANFKTYVVNVDGQGAGKGKNKAQGGSRVMFTSHHPCWDAKNRHGLPDELPLDFKEIAHCFPIRGNTKTETGAPADHSPNLSIQPVPTAMQSPALNPPPEEITTDQDSLPIPASLNNLMMINNVTAFEIQRAVANRGYYPIDMPIGNYPPDFIEGVLVQCWDQVFQMVKDNRKADINNMATPF